MATQTRPHHVHWCDGTNAEREMLERRAAIDLDGLDLSDARTMELSSVDARGWLDEAERTSAVLSELRDRLPLELQLQHRAFVHRLTESMQ